MSWTDESFTRFTSTLAPPFSRLAEVLGSSEPTVSRRYRRLFDDRILRVVGQLDSQRFGQYDWAVRIRCAPGSAPTVATKLAQRPETSWVQLTSGGTEIFSLIHSRDGERGTPLLLRQISVGRQVVDYEAYCLLHLFATGLSAPPWPSDLNPEEIAQLLSSARDSPSIDRPKAKLQDSDWPLVQALADDGRAPYRQLAARTHWHESTVRRRVEELMAAGVLFFDLDLASNAFGLRSQALLWMSMAPRNLKNIAQAWPPTRISLRRHHRIHQPGRGAGLPRRPLAVRVPHRRNDRPRRPHPHRNRPRDAIRQDARHHRLASNMTSFQSPSTMVNIALVLFASLLSRNLFRGADGQQVRAP